MQPTRRTSHARSVQPEQPPQNIAQSDNVNPMNTTGIVNRERDAAPATTTTTPAATTTRRTRSRGTTPVLAPGPLTSTPAPVLETISEGAAQPNEAGTSSHNAVRQSRPKPPARPPNVLDAFIPSFSSRQRQDRQEGTTSAAPPLQQTTGPLLESSQPPPAFSQLSVSFGSAPLGTSFAAAPLNTSFTGPAFATPRGKAINPLTTPSSFVSALSSPTASGNFRDASATVPGPRTLPNNTTTLNAPRDSRVAIILDDESDDNDELGNSTRSRPGRSTGPQLSTRPNIVSADEEDEEEADSHFNPFNGNRKRRTGDRPRSVPVDKEMEFFQEVHAGGNTSGGVSGPRLGGTGGTGRGGGVPQRGGRSQRLARTSGPTVANLMGVSAIETSVPYGGAAALNSHAVPAGQPSTSAVPRGEEISRGRADRVTGGNTSRGPGPGGAGEVSRGRESNVGPYRSSRRRPSPVGMSAHPFSSTGLTPSTEFPSSGNTNADGNTPGNAEASLEGEAGPATQVWRRGLGVLRDIDDDNDDDDVPSRANRSPRRVHPHRRHIDKGHAGDGHAAGDSTNGGAADKVTDDEETARQMAAARRKERQRREVEERRVQRLSGAATPLNLRRATSSDEDKDRTPTQASQVLAFAVAPAPVPSTSPGAPAGEVEPASNRPGLWKSTAGNVAGPSRSQGSQAGAPLAAGNDDGDITNAENRLVHTRTNTGSNQTIISRLDSAVSQVPALPGIPGSFEGLSGIGGQNELGVSQFEESLPAFRYNSRGTGPALSTIHDEGDDNAEVGVSFNPYAPLAEPTESQRPPAAHSDIIYNTSGNPIARTSGELLRAESSDILEPLLLPLRQETIIPAAQPPAASVSGSRGASQSTSSSQGRRKVRFGSYDPADDLVSWDNPGDPNRDRTGETTGPQLFTPEQEELQRRANNVLYHDDYAGNLEFGKSRQTLLDGVVRPLREIRAASTNASPSRRSAAPPQAQTPSIPVLPTTTGPSIGDGPANPVIIDDDSSRHPSPSPEELQIAARHYVRTVVRPDRERRRRGIQSDDEAMQGVTAAQLPPFPLPYDDSSSDEDEVEDDAQPVATVLVPNSSGSALGDDNNGDDPVPAESSKKDEALSEWHEDQLHELELEDQMESRYPMREFIKKTPVTATPLGKLFTKKKASAQPSMSSLGDIADGDHISNFSKEYPPNQEGYMRMHRTSLSDADTEPSVYPSQPVRAFSAAFTPFSEGDALGDAADENRPSKNISPYPQPDNLSISTDNSVMRSQFFSSKLMAYNSEQAGLKPGDEGYNEPPEENYVKWARAEGFSDAASTGTEASVAPVKGKAPAGRPFSNPFFRMPRAKDARMSEEETPRVSGDSFSVIPDSQESPPLLTQPVAPPKAPSKSTKSTDPRRRPQPPVIDTGIPAYSQAGPSQSQPRGPSETAASPQPSSSPSVKNRTAWQLTSAKPYVGSPRLSMRSATPPGSSSAKGGHATMPGLQVASPPPAGSSARSEAEAQIEADLIPETQFSQQTSHDSSSILRRYSQIIQYESHLEGASEDPQGPPPRKPTVLVPGTASISQVSNFVSSDPSAVTTHLSLAAGKDGVDTDEEVMANIGGRNAADSFVELSGLVQEDSFGLSGIGGQNEYVAETQNEQTQNEHIEAPTPAAPIKSFELPDPSPVDAETQQPGSGKRKREDEATEPVQGLADKPSPSKKARKALVPPAPLPAETTERIRRTRSSTTRSNKAPTSRGPLTTPVPPPRLTDAVRSRKRTAAPRTPSPQPQRIATLSSIIESSSPLSPPPPVSIPVHEATVSPARRSKTYLKSRTLVPNSSTSTVEGGEVLGTSVEQAETQTSATQATQDPFKSLARSVGKSKLGKRKASATSANPFVEKSPVAIPKQSTRKRTREELPENDPPSTFADLSPPPSKKHRRETSASTAVQTKVTSKTGKPPVTHESEAHFVSSPHRACQRGGRVFAPWREVYYTATVTDTWKDKAVITCRVQFDDKSWADIPLKSLYRCELHEGDKIKVPGLKGKKLARDGYVSAVPLWEDRHRVSVRLATIPQEEVAIFDGKKIAVAADFVRKEWEDRKAMTLEDIGLGKQLIRAQEEKERKEAEAKAMGRTIPSAAFLGPPRWKDSPPPPPRHASLPSRGRKRPPPATDSEVPVTSQKRRRLAAPSTNNAPSDLPLTNHLIIHALAVNDDKGNPLEKDQRDVQKEELTANIERLGGKVINGFGELLQWGGALSDDDDRWVWEAGDIQEVTDEPSAPTTTKKRRGAGSATSPEPPRIFLVADGPNRNTKYLMALAAGIPCVDQGWVYDESVISWQSYLLPAGQSPSLGHSCSQWIDHSYSEHPRTLKALLDAPGPVRKAFADKSILVLYSSKSGTDIDGDQVAQEYAYAALACLMGASRVEVVHDIEAAFFKLDQYDAIVNEDANLPAPLLKFSKSKKGREVVCNDFSWVRDCLITGTFLRHC